MKEKLVSYIKEKYNPRAIVLHGSRASGHSREHSDWDFVIFTDTDVSPGRDIQFGANLEIKQVILPVSDEKIREKLGFLFRKENIEILFDPGNIVPPLVEKNEKILEKGNTFDEVARKARIAFLISSLDAMKDYQADALVFFAKKSEFYDRAVPGWFRFLHNQFKPSDYLALPYIREKDPVFFDLLMRFVTGSVEESVTSAREIIEHLFPDLKGSSNIVH